MPPAISRRTATTRLTAAATAATLQSLPPVLACEKQKTKEARFGLKYILASSMYGRTALDKILPEVAKTGTHLLDIWPEGHANQREQVEKMGHAAFQEMLKRHKLRLGMITRYDLGPYRLKDETSVVKKLGGRLIVCGAKKAPGKTLKEQVANFVKQLQPHAAVAKKNGVTLGIENHSGSLINTPDSLRFFAEMAPSNVGIAMAPYHLPQKEKLLAQLIRDLGPKLVHFYAWQHGMGCHKEQPEEQEMLQMPGRGPLDFRPLVQALKQINFQGWTEIFMHPFPRGIPIP